MPINPVCSNPHEKEFVARAISKGWTVVRNGWPDFFLMRTTGKGNLKYMAVEVKQDHESDTPRPEQKIMLNALQEIGLDCYVWSSEDKTLRKPGPRKTKRHKSSMVDHAAEKAMDDAESLGVLVRYRTHKPR